MSRPNRILVRALAIVESGWTRGSYARDREGRSIGFSSPTACAWCASGARLAAAERLGAAAEDSFVALWALLKTMEGCIPRFNDSHTKAEVVAAFKAAIEATK